MKALLRTEPGTPPSFTLGELPKPTAGAGQVRICVRAVGLNPADYQLAQTGHPAWDYPHVPGLDIAGTVDSLGRGVAGFKEGQRLVVHADFRSQGGLADYAVVDAVALAKIPDEVSFAEAAAPLMQVLLPTRQYTSD